MLAGFVYGGHSRRTQRVVRAVQSQMRPRGRERRCDGVHQMPAEVARCSSTTTYASAEYVPC